MFRRLLLVILTVLLMAVVPLPQPAVASESSEKRPVLIDEILELVYDYHLKRCEMDDLIRGAIRGILDTLDDPYTEYLSEEEFRSFTDALEGDLVGIGIELEEGHPYPVIVRVIPGSPAAAAGLREGDRVVRVDGQDVAGLSLIQVIFKIRGPEGTKVSLEVSRSDQQYIEYEITRAIVELPTVESRMLDGMTGYIAIRSFSSRTAGEFGDALYNMILKGAQSLILDLRDNNGGFFQAAVDVASFILEPGTVVASLEDRDGNREVYATTGEQFVREMPMVVLVNGKSASASEVLAGALQDYGIRLVGEKTYGKGVVQSIIPLESGGALKLTTYRYLTPRGRNIDGVGLVPDRVVETPELQLEAAWQELHPGLPVQLVYFPGKRGAELNGRKIDSVSAPLEYGDGVYIPMRFTLEALGYEVYWQPEEGVICAEGRTGCLKFKPGSGTASFNGRSVKLGAPVLFYDGKSYLPVAGLSGLGIGVYEQGGRLVLTASWR